MVRGGGPLTWVWCTNHYTQANVPTLLFSNWEEMGKDLGRQPEKRKNEPRIPSFFSTTTREGVAYPPFDPFLPGMATCGLHPHPTTTERASWMGIFPSAPSPPFSFLPSCFFPGDGNEREATHHRLILHDVESTPARSEDSTYPHTHLQRCIHAIHRTHAHVYKDVHTRASIQPFEEINHDNETTYVGGWTSRNNHGHRCDYLTRTMRMWCVPPTVSYEGVRR